MRKPKRRELVLLILKIVEARKPEKVYGYFTRRQLTELYTYLLVRRENDKEIYNNLRALRGNLGVSGMLTGENSTLLRNCMRLSCVKEG